MSDDIPMSVQESFPGSSAAEQTPVAAGVPVSFAHTQPQQFSNFQSETNTQLPAGSGPGGVQNASFQPGMQDQQQKTENSAGSGPSVHPQSQNSETHHQHQPSLQEMEQEAARLRELNSQLDNISNLPPSEIDPQKSEADAKSVYVGNVDYETTPLELQQHFSESGVVERVTIMTNKQTGEPKGFAYLEFASPDGANKAVALLDGSVFRDRELKVSLKRTNIPGLSGGVRGGFRGRARGRGRGGMMMRGRGRGGFRGRGMRGAPRFSPY